MANASRFDGQVAIVTGAGRGLGRHYALALAARGAKVVVNGRSPAASSPERRVVDEIIAAGGEAMAAVASVTDERAVAKMVVDAIGRWGRIDILVSNAGFVRDRSFAKLDLDDFRAVIDVHLNGAAIVTRAVWNQMLARGYGRVILTTSSAGLAGNFGQAAYAAAKMGLVGLMHVLGIEGETKNVRVNCIAPIGVTSMNEAVLTQEQRDAFPAERVVPGLLYLAGADAPNRMVLMAGGGSFERAYVTFTAGRYLGECEPEDVAANVAAISDRKAEQVPASAQTQAEIELRNARGV
jgi:NAD(P)-dependent dehydrogenase (short-subunit alcohol dehydrogenase family)